MNLDQVQRFSRQIALPEVGPPGQARICAARVLVVGAGAAAQTAAAYLRAAGVGAVSAREAAPADGGAWLAALTGVDLVVRLGFDDDAMLGATKRLGLPLVVARATPAQVDLLSFPRRAPAPDASLEVPRQAAAPTVPGAADIVAGTLAAAEALVRIVRCDGDTERVRHLRLPLDGSAPVAQQIGVA
jgi:ThiF family